LHRLQLTPARGIRETRSDVACEFDSAACLDLADPAAGKPAETVTGRRFSFLKGSESLICIFNFSKWDVYLEYSAA
jgi:hypothetical protein